MAVFRMQVWCKGGLVECGIGGNWLYAFEFPDYDVKGPKMFQTDNFTDFLSPLTSRN
jgi:hypothetical protein